MLLLRRRNRPAIGNALRVFERAMSGSTTSTGSVVYEGQRAVDEYLQMHYGKQDDVFPYAAMGGIDGLAFPERSAMLAVNALRTAGGDPAGGAALDVGCAVGGATFALASHFSRVDGMDFSDAFVEAAKSLQSGASIDYQTLEEGSRMGNRTAHVPADTSRARCSFAQGDACNLEDLRDAGFLRADGYNAVHASNLLCRLPRPKLFLKSCSDWVVKPGGVLVLLTPFSWLEEWTPRTEWIGGGEAVSSEALASEMETLGFALGGREDVPFLIREHARKFQYGVSECTAWVRLGE